MGETMAPREQALHMLASCAPASCRVQRLAFVEAGLTEYRDHFAILIHDAFSAAECAMLLEAATLSNDGKWDQALIGRDKQFLDTQERLSDRILWDDRPIAESILDRILPYIPLEVVTLSPSNAVITGNGPARRKETWEVTRLNERLRFLRYTKGMYFRPHCDGSYTTEDGEISRLTVHLYLNGGDEAETANESLGMERMEALQGGATRFWSMSMKNALDVDPKTGAVLIFQQRNLLHSGEDVLQGTKYTMRTDLLYRKTQPDS